MDGTNELTREEQIRAKGFDMNITNYNKIKVGSKNLEDAVLNLGSLKSNLPGNKYTNKKHIYQALFEKNIPELRNISNFFYNMNGIYERACDYFAFLYRYDWYVVPEIYDDSVKEEKVLIDFSKILNFLDNSYIKKICGDIALTVIKEGAYYGYIVDDSNGLVLQQLPVGYCRSRYNVGNMPAIEFNMKFFDTFKDPAYRLKVLKLFPKEFAEGYLAYQKGKLEVDYFGDSKSWYLLDPEYTVKFNLNNNDIPMFVNAIPSLLDLDAAQELDRRKQMQKLLKIIVQKLPLDKNGDLIFDIDEAKDIHTNAVEMLQDAIGTDVLTTFTDVESIDLSDKNTTASQDDIAKVERTVFNNLGIPQNLFNADGNISLEKSVLNDESTVRNLLLQFNMFFDKIIAKKNKNSKKYNFKIYMLETTQYNYRELSKMYKEQVQIGYSKMLPQIALGHSQSFILNTAVFENEYLNLNEIMIPPLMSSTLNGDDILGKNEKSKTSKNTNISTNNSGETKEAGRPEKADDQKSDKTIANRQSMS